MKLLSALKIKPMLASLLYFLCSALPLAQEVQEATETAQAPQYTIQEINQIINDFKKIQPKLESLAEKEEELTTLLTELNKLVSVDFNDEDFNSDEGLTFSSTFEEDGFSGETDSFSAQQTTNDNVASSQSAQDSLSTPSQGMSAAERFRMMQSPSSQNFPSPVVAENSTASNSDNDVDMSNMTAAERFRMMQQTVPPIVRAGDNEPVGDTQSSNDDNTNITEDDLISENAAASSPSNEPLMTASNSVNTDVNEENSTVPLEQLSAAERFRAMQAVAFTPAPASNPSPSTETDDTEQTSNSDALQLAGNTQNISPSQEDVPYWIARNSATPENDVARPTYNPAIRPRSETIGKTPLEHLMLPQEPGQKANVTNQFRGSQGNIYNPGKIIKRPTYGSTLPSRANSERNGEYFLHLFSYKSLNEKEITQNWQKSSESLPNPIKNLKILVRQQITKSGKYNRMYLGPLNSKTEAQDHCMQLKHLNYYCKITKDI
ncbi:MAG: hypothetical protein GJ680_02815 [Alteromonadaceae bacterium]|nr:hypothetical protein [Alteromonadaceae bacterium]